MKQKSPPHESPSTSLLGLVVAILLAMLPASLCHGAAWIADSEGTETRWKADSRKAPGRLVKHERVRLPTGEPGRDRGSEQIAYLHPPGMACWFWAEVPPAAVIEDLSIHVDLRADGPGTHIAAEVVLPRIEDPRTGEALRLVVRAPRTSPTPPDETTLKLTRFPQLVKQRLRAEQLRQQAVQGSQSDSIQSSDNREAYVTRVGLIAPGDIRARSVWVHELRIEGLASPTRLASSSDKVSDDDEAEPTRVPVGRSVPTEITLNSDGFRIDSRPFFPRAWRWSGEELTEISERGFNTLLLDQTLDADTLHKAAANGLRVIAPPPRDGIHKANAPEWDPVVAWLLTGNDAKRNLDTLLAEAQRVRAFPLRLQRPLLIKTRSEAARWSRIADGLVIDTQGSLVEGADGIVRRVQGALISVRPGTPWLAVIGVDIDAKTESQLDALLGEAATPSWLSPGDLSDATHAALALGCRGVAFSSTNRLEGADSASQLARLWLGAMNSHLQLIEPWLVGHGAPTPLRASRLTLLERQGVRLALAPLLHPIGPAGLVLPGVAESAYVFRLTPSGLHSARSKRVAGGLRIETHDASQSATPPGAYVLSNDPRIANSLRQYTLAKGKSTSATWVRAAEEAVRQSQALDPSNTIKARVKIENAKLAAARRDYATAFDDAHAALLIVDENERTRRKIAAGESVLLQSSPLAVLPATLTDHFRLSQLIEAGRRGHNRLEGGSFEDLDYVRSNGWRRHDVGEGDFEVEIAEGSPIDGQHRLRLACREAGRLGKRSPRITSPEIDLRAGELIEVVGWTRVSSVGIQPVGRLRIEDNLGGQGLSLVVGPTEEWRPFRLLRRASEATTLRLVMSIEGAAEAELDGVHDSADRFEADLRRRESSVIGSDKVVELRRSSAPRSQRV